MINTILLSVKSKMLSGRQIQLPPPFYMVRGLPERQKKNSDWDILILLDKPSVSIKEEQLFRHNLYDLELETGESISTFVYAADEWNTKLSFTPLYKTIKQKRYYIVSDYKPDYIDYHLSKANEA